MGLISKLIQAFEGSWAFCAWIIKWLLLKERLHISNLEEPERMKHFSEPAWQFWKLKPVNRKKCEINGHKTQWVYSSLNTVGLNYHVNLTSISKWTRRHNKGQLTSYLPCLLFLLLPVLNHIQPQSTHTAPGNSLVFLEIKTKKKKKEETKTNN